MKKEYIIFDLDGTLIESMSDAVNIIIKELNKIDGFDEEYARYTFSNTAGTPLRKQIELFFKNYNQEQILEITNNLYKKLEEHESDFFEGIPQKVKELSKKYKLFLTTGNSTKVANSHLDKGGIKECFELIYGSDKILKGVPHLEIFEEYSCDDNFYKKSIYIGDGDGDRIFANEKNIDFIHIGIEGKDKYEIESVNYIDNVLKIFEK